MRVNSINNYSCKHPTNIRNVKQKNVSFDGKHDCAKFLGGLFGTLDTLGAIGGTVIMTGGVALPFVIGYGALSAGSGLLLGHQMDKAADKENKNTF